MGIEKILVVDDEPLIRDLLRDILKEEGYEVSIAMEGLSALKKVKREETDLVITDVKMPGLDGIKLLKEIKEVSPSTLVIVITGYGTIENAVEAMKEGAYDYITKPITNEQLKLILQKISQHKNL